MLGEQELRADVRVRGHTLEHATQQVFLKQFFPQPDRHCGTERTETPGGKSKVGFQQPFEFQKGFVVEHHLIDITPVQTTRVQAVGNRLFWKGGIVLFACESFFLRGCHDVTVAHERCGAVVIKRGDAEGVH